MPESPADQRIRKKDDLQDVQVPVDGLSGLSLKAYDREIKPYNTFSAYISKYFMIGDFTDPDGNSVGIFSVELYRGESVERARTAQTMARLQNQPLSLFPIGFRTFDHPKARSKNESR